MTKTFDDYLKENGEIGHIQSIVQSIVYVSGLPSLRPRELVVAEGGQRGIVQSLNGETAEILMLETANLTNGLSVARTNETFQIPVSDAILGRIVNPFGLPIDGAGPIEGERKLLPLFSEAPTFVQRAKVNRPLETGVAMVDLLVPIGYGQRELVIGDKKTGKSTFLLQTMTSEAKKGVICIYVSIGKRLSDAKQVETYLKKTGVMQNCVLLVASSADPATLIYLSAFSGMAIAEHFRDLGKDVIIIFDDLSNHAKFYREISLLSKRAPGRGSYPGNIFHLHASLLERAGQIQTADGKIVSITALPVAETLEGDITGYIQTNLMAITDGHIFFDIEEFRKGKRPAINPSLSVSRVGNQTKNALERTLASQIRETLAKYQRDLEIARFGVELPESTKAVIEQGEKIELIFHQDVETIMPRDLQLFSLGLLLNGYWTGKPAAIVKVDLIRLVQKYQKGDLQFMAKQINKATKLEDLVSIAKIYSGKIVEEMHV